MVSNERGQAAIFVALMFNVLFVFFAMAINVALVVHDKINLQNSVDLAAYYAAAKQAELLNVIAHENYAIRQSYKLLSWRYRNLGTMGLYKKAKHPMYTGELSDTVFLPAAKPSLCIMYKPTWDNVPKGENLCNEENLKIPALPEVKVIAGFLGINHGIAALSRQLRRQFDDQCDGLAAMNWWFGMSILHAFRVDQRNRKGMIYALAQLISGGQNGDFMDLDGNSVAMGAKETFLKNLTYANRQSYESGNGSFEMLNSLEGIDPRQWLVQIEIVPTLIYTDVDQSGGCNAVPTEINSLPRRPDSRKILITDFSAGDLMAWAGASLIKDPEYQFSIGVEKNPWFMAYVGVKASTYPRQIFFPFGDGVQMGARGFAKPFGGRIGPWYQDRWEKGAANSSGNLVDPLMAPRAVAGGLLTSANDPRRLPNYSRFPGDQLGMSSKLALNSVVGLRGLTANFNYYKNIKVDMSDGGMNDVLAANPGGSSSVPQIRKLEIAAIAPDLFDATYYSVEPNFVGNYFGKLRTNRSSFRIPTSIPVRSDLGHIGNISEYSVQMQMDLARSDSLQRSEAYYFLREKAHLLTGWLPGPGTYNYGVDASLGNFGRCARNDDGFRDKNPGSCVAGGGRTGYSVKLINRDALRSSGHQIGGNGVGASSILNPPPEGW